MSKDIIITGIIIICLLFQSISLNTIDVQNGFKTDKTMEIFKDLLYINLADFKLSQLTDYI
jgi:hypothetical protein